MFLFNPLDVLIVVLCIPWIFVTPKMDLRHCMSKLSILLSLVVVEFLLINMQLLVLLYRFLIMLKIYPVNLYVTVFCAGLSSKLYQRYLLSQQSWSKPWNYVLLLFLKFILLWRLHPLFLYSDGIQAVCQLWIFRYGSCSIVVIHELKPSTYWK